MSRGPAAGMCNQRHVVTAAHELADEYIDDPLDASVVHGRHWNIRIRGDQNPHHAVGAARSVCGSADHVPVIFNASSGASR